ncbi:hypothetical protein LEP3755_43150 [Leptolyngbya sp. NIES-3755]|nr:hypothetical protein LEP3755_43150 [Leptolyngbya sp. NIES-3755]
MIRVVNPLIPSVQKLNSLHRNGFQTEVERGLKILIGAIERGESIGDSAILRRLDRIERLFTQQSPVTIATEPKILTEAELCDRFNISPHWRLRVPHGWVAEFWLSQKIGAEYLGNDRYQINVPKL